MEIDFHQKSDEIYGKLLRGETTPMEEKDRLMQGQKLILEDVRKLLGFVANAFAEDGDAHKVEQIQACFPETPFHRQYAEALNAEGQEYEAYQQWNFLILEGKPDTRSCVISANNIAKRGDRKTAAHLWDKILAKYPPDANDDIAMEFAKYQSRTGRFQSAISSFKSLVNRKPDQLRSFARDRGENGLFAQSLELWKILIDANDQERKGFRRFIQQYAETLISEQQECEGLDLLQQAIHIDNDIHSLCTSLVMPVLQNGGPEIVVKIFSDYPSLKSVCGSYLHQCGIQERLLIGRSILNTHPEDGMARHEYATALLSAKRVDDAIGVWIPLDITRIKACARFVISLYEHRYREHAIRLWSEVMRVMPKEVLACVAPEDLTKKNGAKWAVNTWNERVKKDVSAMTIYAKNLLDADSSADQLWEVIKKAIPHAEDTKLVPEQLIAIETYVKIIGRHPKLGVGKCKFLLEEWERREWLTGQQHRILLQILEQELASHRGSKNNDAATSSAQASPTEDSRDLD